MTTICPGDPKFALLLSESGPSEPQHRATSQQPSEGSQRPVTERSSRCFGVAACDVLRWQTSQLAMSISLMASSLSAHQRLASRASYRFRPRVSG